MFEIRSFVNETSCVSVVPNPYTGFTTGSFAATKLGRPPAGRSCSLASAARLPLDRAVSVSTDIGKSFHSNTSASNPTEPHSNRL